MVLFCSVSPLKSATRVWTNCGAGGLSSSTLHLGHTRRLRSGRRKSQGWNWSCVSILVPEFLLQWQVSMNVAILLVWCAVQADCPECAVSQPCWEWWERTYSQSSVTTFSQEWCWFGFPDSSVSTNGGFCSLGHLYQLTFASLLLCFTLEDAFLPCASLMCRVLGQGRIQVTGVCRSPLQHRGADNSAFFTYYCKHIVIMQVTTSAPKDT